MARSIGPSRPKREGVSFEWAEPGPESGPEEKPESPFAALKRLK
jgi:hypothetical protein